MKRLTLLALILLPLLSSLSAAQPQRPEWIKASELYQKYDDTQDLSYLQNSLYRCSAFNVVFGALFTRDRPSDSVGSDMQEIGMALQTLGDLAGYKKITDNGGIPDKSVLTMGTPLYMGMAENYSQWLNYSYTNFGEYTGDPQIVEEITFCRNTIVESVPGIMETLEL